MDDYPKSAQIIGQLLMLGVGSTAASAAANLIANITQLEEGQQHSTPSSAAQSRRNIGEIAERLLQLSISTESAFGILLSTPAWNILLALLMDEEKGRQSSPPGTCFICGIDPAIAMRYIKHLISSGHVERLPNPQNTTSIALVLSRKARTDLINLIENVLDSDPVRRGLPK